VRAFLVSRASPIAEGDRSHTSTHAHKHHKCTHTPTRTQAMKGRKPQPLSLSYCRCTVFVSIDFCSQTFSLSFRSYLSLLLENPSGLRVACSHSFPLCFIFSPSPFPLPPSSLVRAPFDKKIAHKLSLAHICFSSCTHTLCPPSSVRLSHFLRCCRAPGVPKGKC